MKKPTLPPVMDSKSTLLHLLTGYLTRTKPVILLVHLLYIGAICMFLSMSYLVTFNWGSIVKIYDEAHDIDKFSANLKLSVESDNIINQKLQTIMESFKGMRGYVYRYHNGLAAISGVPFFFQSNTHEVIAPGAARLLPFEQRIPASIHVSMNNNFIQDKCIAVTNTTVDKDNINFYFFSSRNATAMVRCPIYLNNGDLFGFIGVDLPEVLSAEDQAKFVPALHAVAKQIGGLFVRKPVK